MDKDLALEELVDAMFLAHEMIGRAKHGESLVKLLNMYIGGIDEGSESIVPKPDLSLVSEFEQNVRNNMPNEKKYHNVIPTLKKYEVYKGVKFILDELKKEFPKAQY